MEVPDPIEFAGQQFGGNLITGGGMPVAERDFSGWTPLVRQIANQPESSGMLKQAFIRQFRNLSSRPMVPDLRFVDLFDLDDQVESMLDYGESG